MYEDDEGPPPPPLGPNSIDKFWLEFRLEKSLEICLEIPHTKKMLKMGSLDVSESKWNQNQFFKPKLKPKVFLLNWVPEGVVHPREERVGLLKVFPLGGLVAPRL